MQIVGFNLFYSGYNVSSIEIIIAMIITIFITLSLFPIINLKASNILKTIILILMFFLINVNCNKYFVKKFGIFKLTIYYINKNNENIEINKNQIINDIINDKIENNDENLQVYKQAFQISYDEYKLLKPHEIEYENQSEYGNVEIIE